MAIFANGQNDHWRVAPIPVTFSTYDEGAPGPLLLETWETTNPLARKRRLPHRRCLQIISPSARTMEAVANVRLK
jgi:hypothetical protein